MARRKPTPPMKRASDSPARPRGEATRTTAPAAAQAAATPALWVALAASVAGIVLSLVLVRLHAQAHAGVESFCAISDTVNCDRVATSRYSVVLGLPVALWGVVGYGLAAALAAWGLTPSGRRSHAPAGLLVAVSALAVAASVVLAVVSEVAIGALCLLCAGSWLLSLVLLVAAARACRGRGVRAAVGDGVQALRGSPGRVAAAAMVFVVVIGAAAAFYPRYWERPRAGTAPPRGQGATPGPGAQGTAPSTGSTGSTGPAGPQVPAPSAPAAPAAESEKTVVVEYSDYECPYCARAHEEMRAIVQRRPDLTVVRRHFPLDSSCNPAVSRQVHPGACRLARAGICAEAQGKFGAMDDALFRNQRPGLDPVAIARQLGLDVERFEGCLGSPETSARLQADIAAAMRDGVRATPTYVVGGVARAGQFPLDLVPPR
jgi:protein-disulfide isomerase